MKILLISDLENWILGRMARCLSKKLSGYLDISVLFTDSGDFRTDLARAQLEHDVVHFLSPWDFFKWVASTYRPCIMTLWHVLEWAPFDRHVSRADTICVGSEQWKRRARARFPSNIPIQRLPYGLDTARFRRHCQAREEFLNEQVLPPETLVFGFAGKASSNRRYRKGLDRLWECLERIQTEIACPWALRIMGRGWQYHTIPESLRPSVHPELSIDDSKVPTFFSSLDYYVCTSRQEGVPYPVIEAMSCEAVVMSTLVGIVPEILIDGENGFILDEDTIADDFLRIVTHTMSKYARRARIGQHARDTVRTSLDWEKVIIPSRFADIYETAVRVYQTRSVSQRLAHSLRLRLSAAVRRAPDKRCE